MQVHIKAVDGGYELYGPVDEKETLVSTEPTLDLIIQDAQANYGEDVDITVDDTPSKRSK